MAPPDSVWHPHIVSFNSKHFKGPHHDQMHHFHFPPVGLQSMTRKFSYHRHKSSHTGGEPRPSSWTPNTDIRETKLAYHIEIEVPGVMDRQSLLIQWMSPRTLLVEGDIKRPLVGRGKNAEGETLWEQEGEDWSTEARKPQEDPETEQGEELQRMPSADSTDLPTFLCDERNVGPWQRTFTLPADVDMKALRARLEAGLLCIDLPKRDMTGEPMVKIEVQ